MTATPAEASACWAAPVGAWVIHDGEATWKPTIDLDRLALFAFLLGLVLAFRR